MSSFHSIGIPSEWGLMRILGIGVRTIGFHSIGIPSEWGPSSKVLGPSASRRVSIQLGSPASGDSGVLSVALATQRSFHSIGIPSEWGQLRIVHTSA